jgi:DNA-binding transcriptional LysR family regulator
MEWLHDIILPYLIQQVQQSFPWVHVSITYMDIDARRLRILHAVVQTGGVSEAGRMLAMTPQGITQQIATLEREVGTQLFDRSQRRLEPTLLAHELAQHGERIEAELLAARRCIVMSTGLASGPVRIATFQSAIRWLVVSALPRIRASAPGVVPEIIEMTGVELQRALRSGAVDLAIDEVDRPERDKVSLHSDAAGIVTTLIRPDPYRVVVAVGKGKSIRTVADALKQPWIVSPAGSTCRVAFDRLATRHKTQPRIVHTCLEFPAVLALVEAGEGIALIPALGLLDHAAVDVCDIRGLGGRDLIALQRKSRRGTEPAVDAVVQVLTSAHMN